MFHFVSLVTFPHKAKGRRRRNCMSRYLRGNCAYPPEKLIIEQTANICNKTLHEQDSPEPNFCGAKIAAKGQFETCFLSIFFEWVKRKHNNKDECSLSNWNRYSIFPLGASPLAGTIFKSSNHNSFFLFFFFFFTSLENSVQHELPSLGGNYGLVSSDRSKIISYLPSFMRRV